MIVPVETRTALLPSDGFADGRVTRHTFVRHDRILVDNGAPPFHGWACIFRCERTGVERRWGLS